jgi:hypothetical protein
LSGYVDASLSQAVDNGVAQLIRLDVVGNQSSAAVGKLRLAAQQFNRAGARVFESPEMAEARRAELERFLDDWQPAQHREVQQLLEGFAQSLRSRPPAGEPAPA